MIRVKVSSLFFAYYSKLGRSTRLPRSGVRSTMVYNMSNNFSIGLYTERSLDVIVSENAFSVFGSPTSQKDDRDLSSLWMGLGRYILITWIQFYEVINSRKECLFVRSPWAMLAKLCKAECSEKSEKVVLLWSSFLRSHFFSLKSSFQADLFDPWWRGMGGGGGALAPIALPCQRAWAILHWRTLVEKEIISMILCSIQNTGPSFFLSFSACSFKNFGHFSASRSSKKGQSYTKKSIYARISTSEWKKQKYVTLLISFYCSGTAFDVKCQKHMHLDMYGHTLPQPLL